MPRTLLTQVASVGLLKCLSSLGWSIHVWPRQDSAHDMFYSIKPSVVWLDSSWDNRAAIKCLEANPSIVVGYRGEKPLLRNVMAPIPTDVAADLLIPPVKPVESLKCDIGYAGSHKDVWTCFAPFCQPEAKEKVRILCDNSFIQVQRMDTPSPVLSRQLAIGSKVTLCLGELTDAAMDAALLGSFVLANFANDYFAYEDNEEEFVASARYFLKHKTERKKFIERAKLKIGETGTYHHRASTWLDNVGLTGEAEVCLANMEQLK